MKSYIFLLVAGMLISGSINTIAKKLGYGTCSTSSISGDYTSTASCPSFSPNGHQFRKPWTQTLVMFTGEAMCLLLFFYRRSAASKRERAREEQDDEQQQQQQQQQQQYQPLPAHHTVNNNSPAYNFLSPTMARVAKGSTKDEDDQRQSDTAYSNVTLGSSLYCLLPACCDLGGTTVSGIGLLFTSASVFQMLRGSIIFFTAIFSVLFLNRKLQTFHWTGMGLTVVGVTMIGVSSILGASNESPVSPSVSPSPSSLSPYDDFSKYQY